MKKSVLSAFVLLTFGAYAVEHSANSGQAAPAMGSIASVVTPSSPDTSPAQPAPTQTAPAEPAATATGAPASAATSPAPARQAAVAATAEPTAVPAPPTAVPAPTDGPVAPSKGGYKDGTYTGPSVDVQYGLVQVQATIRGGKLTDVQFLQYPSDRRTSARINSQADPWLQQEAIQAQSANVDIIGGATLTSEGFQQSLDTALQQAKS